MPDQTSQDPANPLSEIVQALLPESLPAGVKFAIPFVVIEDLVADAAVNSVQNPSDQDCLVGCIIDVVTVDATETMDVGVDTDGTTTDDTLFDALDVAVAGVKSSFSDADTGTNGIPFVKVDKKGGTNDFLVFTASAGTDVLAGKIIFIFIPIGD